MRLPHRSAMSDDWYLRQNNGQWYQKVGSTWHGRYLPLALSNADPEDVATAADSGTCDRSIAI